MKNNLSQDEKSWLEKIKDWAPAAKKVAIKYPAYKCWRSTEAPEFHYTIIDYAHHRDTGEITLTLVHARGTSRAGVATFGQPPEQLIPCNCGKWEPPTEEEKKSVRERMQRLNKGRPCSCPACMMNPNNPQHHGLN